MPPFYRGPLRTMDENMDGDDNDSDLKTQESYFALFLFMGISPVAAFLLVPIWVCYWNRRQHREAIERRLVATKLAERIREAHLTELMQDHNTVLCESDVCDGDCDLEQTEAQSMGTFTIETCDQTLSSHSNDRKEGGCDDDVSENDEIKMQYPKTISPDNDDDRGEEDVGDWNSIECRNSQCHHCSVFIPIPGQGGAANLSRRTVSEGCAICMNSFKVGQRVVWSSNPECNHVFHYSCLLGWFVAVGTKKWKAHAARHLEMEPAAIQEEICKFSKLCPFCRRYYFTEDRSEEAEEDTAETTHNENESSNNDRGNDGVRSYNDNNGTTASEVEERTSINELLPINEPQC